MWVNLCMRTLACVVRAPMASSSSDGEQPLTVLLCVPAKVRHRLGELLNAPVQGVRFVPRRRGGRERRA